MARGTAYCHCKTCGKNFIKYAYNLSNRRRAEEWEAWAQENIVQCVDCWKAEKEAERAAFAQKANAELAEITEGSEKQIAWAKKIRVNAKRGIDTLSDKENISDAAKSFFAWLLNGHTDARWWIDHREDLNDISILSFREGLFLGDLLIKYAAEEKRS